MAITTNFVIKSYGKAELAGLYGWNIKTLQKKMRYYGLEWPPSNVFTPKNVANIVETLGAPSGIYEEKTDF